MNREIKFRAWDGDKMIEGVSPWQWDFVISKSWHRCEKSTGGGILGSGGKTAEMLVPAVRFNEIMQFTGLKDMNGKEIYEGDILLKQFGSSTPKFPVAWDNERAMFIQNDGYNEPLFQIDTRYVEVIGNIFENPKLVKP